jgi:hypothetical protein
MKTPGEYFRDWEGNAFGFGYGTGEPVILPALRAFMAAVPLTGAYDYRVLEAAAGPVPAWLFINRLCGLDLIRYGTSPRFGWLTEPGKALQTFMLAHTADRLVEIVTDYDEDYTHCYPNACNCGPDGYDAKLVCQNPFWVSGRTAQ